MRTFLKKIPLGGAANILAIAIGCTVGLYMRSPVVAVSAPAPSAPIQVTFCFQGHVPRVITRSAEYVSLDGVGHNGMPSNWSGALRPVNAFAEYLTTEDEEATKYIFFFDPPPSGYALRFQIGADSKSSLIPDKYLCTPERFNGLELNRGVLNLQRESRAGVFASSSSYFCEVR
jgi:hypothetical protein